MVSFCCTFYTMETRFLFIIPFITPSMFLFQLLLVLDWFGTLSTRFAVADSHVGDNPALNNVGDDFLKSRKGHHRCLIRFYSLGPGHVA